MESNVATANVEDVHVRCSSSVFPLRLYRFLHEAEEYHLSHIASFQPDGRSFQIHNRIEFVTATSRWFSFSKYESFQRQLNIYGFKRVLGGTDKGCYYHKNFIRGQYLLAQGIKRIAVKKMMIASSINHRPVTGVHEMTTGTSTRAGPNLASANSQHIQNDLVSRHDGGIYNQHLTTATNVAIQPNLQQDTTPHRSSDHYLLDTLHDSSSTLRTNNLASSIPLLQAQPNIRGTNTPLVYDTDVSTLSVLQRIQNASNQSVTHSLIPISLPITTLSSLSLHETSILSQLLHERATNAMSSIPLLQTQPNNRGTNAPLVYDTDVSIVSVLQRLQNASNQPVTDSFLPFSLPTTTLESLPLQQTSILSQLLHELLTNHARLQAHGLINRARLQTPPEMDLSPLLLHLGAHTGNTRGQSQLPPSQSSTLYGSMPIHPNSSVNVAVIQDILLQQQNELNRRLPDEQTIRNAIMLLQQQLPPNSISTDIE